MTYPMFLSLPVLLGAVLTAFEYWRDHQVAKAKWRRWKRCQEAS